MTLNFKSKTLQAICLHCVDKFKMYKQMKRFARFVERGNPVMIFYDISLSAKFLKSSELFRIFFANILKVFRSRNFMFLNNTVEWFSPSLSMHTNYETFTGSIQVLFFKINTETITPTWNRWFHYETNYFFVWKCLPKVKRFLRNWYHNFIHKDPVFIKSFYKLSNAPISDRLEYDRKHFYLSLSIISCFQYHLFFQRILY